MGLFDDTNSQDNQRLKTLDVKSGVVRKFVHNGAKVVEIVARFPQEDPGIVEKCVLWARDPLPAPVIDGKAQVFIHMQYRYPDPGTTETIVKLMEEQARESVRKNFDKYWMLR